MNSPNITLNVDTNRSVGPGAGNVAITINTITIAETTLPEYSSGSGRAIRISVKPGFQFDPSSAITAQSATIGLNGGAVNAVATVTPTGAADEVITFNLTSGTSTTVQDIIRVNGARIRILNALGAAGPAQTTMSLTTSTAGGAFTDQGIVAANIVKGAPDRLFFSAQPGSTQSGGDLLPAVSIVDFGGNLLNNVNRNISLTLQSNPGGATLEGLTQRQTSGGIATWENGDDLRIVPAAAGYTLRATQTGASFLSSNSVDSTAFEITAGPPNRLEFSLEPVDTVAGADILVAVTVRDQSNNVVTNQSVDITLDAAVNPGGWPLLVDSSLTKTTISGVARWEAGDNLRINKSIADYQLQASGVGAPVLSAPFDILPAAPALLQFVQQPSGVQEDQAIAPPVSVEILDQFANRTTATDNVAVILQSACGGLITGDIAAAVSGLATFDALRINTPCAGVTLEAVSSTLARATSGAFDVSQLPPVAIRFVQQPVNVEQNAALDPAVSVEIVDAEGKRAASSAVVDLTLVSSCGGALSTASVAAAGGVATFAGLSIDTACAGVTLQASSSGLAAATSDAFDVVALPDLDDDIAACGACGAGAALSMAPVLLSLVGLKLRSAVRRRR